MQRRSDDGDGVRMPQHSLPTEARQGEQGWFVAEISSSQKDAKVDFAGRRTIQEDSGVAGAA